MRESGPRYVRIRRVFVGQTVRLGEAREEERRRGIRVPCIGHRGGQTQRLDRDGAVHQSVWARPQDVWDLIGRFVGLQPHPKALLPTVLRQLSQHR